MSVLVVVASYNGKDFLPRLLSSLEEHKKEEFDILVVDTGTTDIESLKVLESIKSKYMVEKTPYAGYDTGAYIYAIKGHLYDEYIFLHDSIEVLSDSFINDFRVHQKDVCYYANFCLGYDNEEQRQHLVDIGIFNSKSTHGCFGPLFYAKRNVLEDILKTFEVDKIIPTTKIHQQGMERGWSMMFDKVTNSIASITTFDSFSSSNIDKYRISTFGSFRKYYPTRQ